MWHPTCMQFLNRAAVSWFSVMATKFFPAVTLLTCSRAIPANANVIKGIKIPHKINTTWISAQLNEITSLSSETMVCPSEILQGNQSCSGQQEQSRFTGRPQLSVPAWQSHQPQQAGGMQDCDTPALWLWLCCNFDLRNTYQKAMAKSHCGICMGHPFSCSWLFHSLPFPTTCDVLPKLCSSSLWKFFFFAFFPFCTVLQINF